MSKILLKHFGLDEKTSIDAKYLSYPEVVAGFSNDELDGLARLCDAATAAYVRMIASSKNRRRSKTPNAAVSGPGRESKLIKLIPGQDDGRNDGQNDGENAQAPHDGEYVAGKPPAK